MPVTPLCSEVAALAAELPQLLHSLTGAMSVTFATSTADLVSGAESIPRRTEDVYRTASLAIECQGILAGLHPPCEEPALFWRSWSGLDRSAAAIPAPSDPLQLGAIHFLKQLREGKVETLGSLSDTAEQYTLAFVDGALRVFPQAREGRPAFFRSTARAWGRLSAQGGLQGYPPVFPRSEEMGGICAGILRVHYCLGIAGGLPTSRLDASLHVRDIVALLRAKGWLLGIIESLHRTFEDQSAEPARILENNRASLLTQAFNSGRVTYIRDAARAVIDPGSFLASLDTAIDAVGETDTTTASLLRSRRNMVISKLLHAGQLHVDRDLLLGLKGWDV